MSSIFGGVAPGTVVNIPPANAGLDFTANHAGTVDSLQWWFATGGGNSLALTLYDAQTQAALASVGPMSTAGFTANAWNVVPLGAPVAITPGHVYTAAGWTNGANTGLTANGLANHAFAADLTGLRRTGRFDLGGVPAFPTTASSNGADQWPVDVVFTQTPTCPECPPCPPTEGFLINLTSPGFIHVVTGVGQCVIEALDQTPAGAPCRQCLLLPTQAVPWDDCGPCHDDCSGQVALAIREVYGSERFPSPLNGASWRKCNHRYEIVRAVVSVTRCVPAMAQDGAPPDCPSELAAAVTLENDRTAIRQAIACCLGEANRLTPYWVSEWVLGGSTTVGELGGCAGVETEFLVGVQSCLCPD